MATSLLADWIAGSIAAVLILMFLLLASRDISLLFRSPTKRMGPGTIRIWAVGRTTMLEAWAARVWLLPLLWLVASVIMLLTIRPFEESDRIPLYIRVLLTGQEILLMVMIWVLACTSFPMERFKKIVVTNASKPISRLEMFLGKITGFVGMAALLLAIMGTTSFVILVYANHRIKVDAQAEYDLAQEDFHNKERSFKEAAVPPESLKDLAQNGSLFAYNYITVPDTGMSIVGNVKTTPTKTIRFIKGGSEEKIVYTFSPRLEGAENAALAGPGQRPFFGFYFPVVPIDPREPPNKVMLEVTAVRAKQQLRPQRKTLVLDPRLGYRATWEPDNVDELFTFPGDVRDNGEVQVIVSCPTEGVLLQVLDGLPMDQLSTATSTPFNVVAFPGGNVQSVQVPLPDPVVRGFERHDKQQIAGPSKQEIEKYGDNAPKEAAIYRFPAKSLAHVPINNGNFTLSMNLDIDKESNQNADTEGWLEVYNQNSPSERFDQHFQVVEKRSVPMQIPVKYLGDTDPAKRGQLVAILRCDTSGHWLGVGQDSVRIERPAEPFFLNLVKSELVILFEASLFIVICVTWSILLGWPVAMLTTAVVAMLGFFREFILNLPTIGGLGTLGFPNFGVESSSYRFFDTVLQALWRFLGFLVALIPDFTRYDYLKFIIQLRNMPGHVLALDLMWSVIYALPFIGLGYFFFRKQELG